MVCPGARCRARRSCTSRSSSSPASCGVRCSSRDRFRSRLLFLTALRRRLPDLDLEGQPPDPARERLDAVGVVRRQSDGAAAARSASRQWSSPWPGPGRSARSRSSSRIPRIAPCSAWRPKPSRWRRPGMAYVWLGGVAGALRRLRSWRDRWSAPSRPTSSSTPVSSPAPSRSRPSGRAWKRLARRFPVERRELHGRRHRRRARGRRHCQRGEHWKAVLMLAPVYLTYRTYQLFVGRLEDQKRHTAETQRLHQETVEALMQARQAEQALAQEKERLAVDAGRADAARGDAQAAARARAGRRAPAPRRRTG